MRIELDGYITSAGFASGDRIVVGNWRSGPYGPMNDIMWAQPDNTRVLIAPTDEIAAFIDSVYGFDEILIAPVHVGRTANALAASGGPLRMRAELGRAIAIPLVPAFVTRYVANPIAQRLMNVSTWGVTQRGVEEWYRASQLRRIRSAIATVDGVDLGEMTAIAPLEVGISEPPAFPSSVKVRPLLKFP